jgi:hypothetical protein
MTTSYIGYILIMFTHRAHACESACVSASMIKRSLIFDPVLSKFGGDIQQIHRGYIGYLMCMWMHVLTARTSIHLRIVTHDH